MIKRKYTRFLILIFLTLLLVSLFWAKDFFKTPKDHIENSVDEINIELTEWAIISETSTIKRGKKVKLLVENKGNIPHDFVIPELDLKTRKLEPGEQENLTFNAKSDITVVSFCSLPGHREAGMVAKIKVE
jgi:uncharacterized cupredoxin-like copper-binding protein